MDNQNKFLGPLFIVGMHRSGTKLIRDLLNQHPRISIPTIESYCIPYLINQFGNPPKFEDDNEFQNFYDALTKTTFFSNMQSMGFTVSKAYLDKNIVDRRSWSEIFEVIFRFYIPQEKNKDVIWGDKTPQYLSRLRFLKALYPQAKFIHIIRHPGDYCISAKKAWGKNIFRSANSWRYEIENARIASRDFADDYLEVFYENLVEEPEQVLSNICDFLGCEFNTKMLYLDRPTENLGDTKGQVEIVKTNKYKYLKVLNIHTIKRIEEIVYPVASSLGYDLKFAKKFKPLNPLMEKILLFYDACASANFHIKDEGFIPGLIRTYRIHKYRVIQLK
ncbi:MAG: sulfotransferase [Xenococcus sp. MO_188.B8]|nr:sulfotransferase [Xenococcus sp. MO_188.B8]